MEIERGIADEPQARANQTTTIEFTPDKAGDYTISCSMNMTVPATLRVS